MRNHLRIAPAIGLAGLLACCSGLIGIDINASGTATVQGSALGSVLSLPAGFGGLTAINLSQESAFKNQNTDKDHITSCRVSKLTVKVNSPASQDLSFLTSIAFSISAPNLPKVRIAHVESIPAGAHSVDLTIDDVQLGAYCKADTFSVTTDASGHAPPQDTTIEADLRLHIDANLL